MRRSPALPAHRLDRSRFELVVDERFDGATLDDARWMPEYLPHWSTPDRSAARYSLTPQGLELRVDHDQPAWSPEFDGELRVSNLQTGSFSGPVGSAVGQHRFRDGLIVRTAVPERRLWQPRCGLVEARIRPSLHPRALTALWLIGHEAEPEQSGELCVVELFGGEIDERGATSIGAGVHPFGDPRLREQFARVPVAGDARGFRTYSLEWMPGTARWYVDDLLIAEVDQSPDYPLQLMLNLYDLPLESTTRDAESYPMTAGVAWVREWRARDVEG
ncbi:MULTISPECIES: glycoside hydrolase family 16 protein [unclassified Microcella]|uniref:glycoside hydrolase family 16 protein n=1 Tax=unclassified Microcella TaxID=2630066 RepID=UPI0012E34259|nr:MULTISPECIES: glycoside hydrolase family 16 protein [unclassified Microcella]